MAEPPPRPPAAPRPYWCIGAVCWPPAPPPPPEWSPLGVLALASSAVVLLCLCAFVALATRVVKLRRRHEQGERRRA